METNDCVEFGSFEATKAKSEELERQVKAKPHEFRVLTGDRPTGLLHIGHLFGSLQNRVYLQSMGVPTYVVIADYQVLTDRDSFENIGYYTKQIAIDYLAAGLDPEANKTFIFPHSYVPELNQLLLPFLMLVSNSELDRNPTVKEEIESSGQNRICSGMYTYPVHQAADILFCKANIVPVGKDQLPHLELARTIAKRFNERFAGGKRIFPQAGALLSKSPLILGLDGSKKMSKSRNNAVLLSASEDETCSLIKKAKSDSERKIYFDPESRPEISNLLLVASLCTGETPAQIAEKIGDGGGGELKSLVAEVLNEYLRPLRKKRKYLENNQDYIVQLLKKGIEAARTVAENTLVEVREAMGMVI